MAPRLLIKVRVVDVREETKEIKSFTLAPVHRRELPPYPGGAHTIVQLPNGQRRNYSLCGDPHDSSTYRIAVLRENAGRGCSVYMHERIGVGDEMWLTHPQDNFTLDTHAKRHILIAGGIGITALSAMLRDLPPTNRVELHYCVRSEAHAAFLDELRHLPGRLQLYRGDHGERLDVQHLLAHPTPGAQVYCCGPERLMAAVRAASAAWPEGTVRFEPFGGVDRSRTTHGEPFEVELLASKRRLEVPADRTLLEVLRDAGVTVDSACEAGICRTCKVQLIEGEPIHHDLCLSSRERAEALTACVSRGKGVLRLLL
jgi:ferredoxin-NADP reductase